MSDSRLGECRTWVHDKLGSQLAAKATDRFCLAVGASGELPGKLHGVMEFEPDPGYPQVGDVTVAPRVTEAVRDAVELVRAALAEPGSEGLAARVGALLDPTELLRESYIRELRERCHRAAGGVRYGLDRGIADSEDSGSEPDGAVGGPPLPTRYCWLNQTLRTWTAPGPLAEAARDPLVETIDLPRWLRPEIGQTATVVGAQKHRLATGRTGKGVIVAVIDFEVDRGHPAFGDRVVHKKNYTSEAWGHPGAHGTAVAGIIAARGALSGMAPDAVIYNYKVFMTGRPNLAEDFDGALALQRALEDGARIANCSWGTDAVTDGTSREARACDNVWACGMTVVNSAGNGGHGRGTITSPADAKGVIAVGATDRDGLGVQPYSSRGPARNGNTLHLVAPGGRRLRGIDSCLAAAFGDCKFGTSLAAAHVAGLLAVMLEGRPRLTPDEQRQSLMDLCAPLTGDKHVQGKGLASIAALR